MIVKINKKIVFGILGVLALANVFLFIVIYNLNKNKGLEVVFFNVGQGDAAFIEARAGQQILIDGGPDSSIIRKLAKEMPFYDRTLDLIILSHPEKDHLAGLLDVLKRYKVENILWTGIVRDTAEYKEWEKLIKEEGAKIKIAQSGQRIILQENLAIFIDILNPAQDLAGEVMEDSNDSSVVARLSFGTDSFLFTGDIGRVVEEGLGRQNISSSVLKIAHHGSKNSDSEEFIKNVSPKIAVISVGNNSYGHPSSEVLATLKKFAINVLITKLNGDIKIISNGNNF